MTSQEFLDECKNARVVITSRDYALLIGDEVIEIAFSAYGASNRSKLLVKALRGEMIADPEYKMTVRDPSGKEWVA